MYIGNLFLISPALVLCALAIVVLLLGAAESRKPGGWLSHWLPSHYLAPAVMIMPLILSVWIVVQSIMIANNSALGIVKATIGDSEYLISAASLFVTPGGHTQLTVDPYAALFSVIAIVGTLVVMMISIDHFGENQRHKGEYYSLLMFAAAATSLLAASVDLIAIYLAIEFLSLVSYALAAYAKTDRRSGEAGLKYFLYGAACSATMLYGMSLLFGLGQGSASLDAIAANFAGGAGATAIGWIGMMFTLAGFGFKLALVPFHFRAPDTYEGAPTPVTAFLSVVSKAAGVAVIMRLLTMVLLPGANGAASGWYWTLVALTAISMFYGNLIAIPQKNIKRMLAYSSIAQIGYIMIGVLVAMREAQSSGAQTLWGVPSVVVYLIAYLFMNLGAFAVVVAIAKAVKSNDISGFAGLIRREPFMAGAMTVFLVSLAGIPPTAGFIGKFYIFGGAISAGAIHPEILILAIIGIVNSVISAFYYLNVVRVMFFSSEDAGGRIQTAFVSRAVVGVLLVLTLGVILAFGQLSGLMESSVGKGRVANAVEAVIESK